MAWNRASGLAGCRLCPLPDRGLSFPVWERWSQSPDVPEQAGQPCLGLHLAMGEGGSAPDEPGPEEGWGWVGRGETGR